jgi:hypothetical protein
LKNQEVTDEKGGMKAAFFLDCACFVLVVEMEKVTS